MQVYLNASKIANFWVKNADVNETQGSSHVIYIFFNLL